MPDVFYGLSTGVQLATRSGRSGAVAHILLLDSEAKMISVYDFATNEDAAGRYLALEKENLGKPNIQSVLVSVDSIQQLKAAYPSFYLDTTQFSRIVHQLII